MAEQARGLVTALLALFDSLSTKEGYVVERHEAETTLYARALRIMSLNLDEPIEESLITVWLDDLRETTGLKFGAIIWSLTGQPGFSWVRTRAPRASNVVETVGEMAAEEPDAEGVCEGLRLWLQALIELRL